ncbi:AAA domain-containing protein [Paenirhodobacter populi]|uniref:AAA domain-containing protein n=1 Tax=Paenirhodobacter populi TaxID=2306993 RepID=UPI000FE42A43|nr:AAA domain-containing protein [Sinirhodobacter populi]RWR04071.1 hypothetical protein D2T32_20810 [Sinirhodobacter populi]
MLADPWRVRRSSRETLEEIAQADEHFQDLDLPKRSALNALWSTLPSCYVVGPPGVGKTRLATEIVRRRFAQDRPTWILLTAQGEAREQFDWVIVEETAKATGPELAGPMMLSGRRLLIGDHHQLPPFEADRLVKVLQNHALVLQAIELSEQYVGPLLRDGDTAELTALAADANRVRDDTPRFACSSRSAPSSKRTSAACSLIPITATSQER